MKKVRERLGGEGAVGESMYIATPICCPSRTETLSGRLYTNVVEDNLGGCMHVNSTGYIFQHSSSIFPALQRAGYLTGGFGKIINGQKRVFTPPKNKAPIVNGWDWLSVPLDEGDYFGPEHFERRPNGTMWVSSLGDPKDVVDTWYQTAQIGNRSLEFIDYALSTKKPFVAYLGPHAPHYSADAPPWARDDFDGMGAPRTPAYNTSEGQDTKARHVMQNPPLDDQAAMWIDRHFRDRWRAIVGVDDMVGLVLDHLETRGVLADTYVFFSSDHGYKLGEWRIGCSKQHPYESDVHIPFFARGPGIAAGTRLSALISNIDIGPTFLEIAGLPPNPEHDGKSLLSMLHGRGEEVSQVIGGKNNNNNDGLTQQYVHGGGGGGVSTIGTSDSSSWRTTQLIVYLSVGTYFNDHAKIWLSGPAAKPGTRPMYGNGPYKRSSATLREGECGATELDKPNAVGEGKCYFVDSQASNNWVAIRVRNATHNFMYAESYGKKAMAAKVPGGGTGLFACLPGDFCAKELYNYGAINASEYPHYPVMTRERWALDNAYTTTSNALKATLHAELQHAYCSQRRLGPDRMQCASSGYERILS